MVGFNVVASLPFLLLLARAHGSIPNPDPMCLLDSGWSAVNVCECPMNISVTTNLLSSDNMTHMSVALFSNGTNSTFTPTNLLVCNDGFLLSITNETGDCENASLVLYWTVENVTNCLPDENCNTNLEPITPTSMWHKTTEASTPTSISYNVTEPIKTEAMCQPQTFTLGSVKVRFNKTRVWQTAASEQTCKGSTGRSIAFARCLPNTSSNDTATFKEPYLFDCNVDINDTLVAVEVDNITTNQLENRIQTLAIVLGSNDNFNVNSAEMATDVLLNLSKTDPVKVKIEPTTMFSVLVSTERLTKSLSKSPKVASKKKQQELLTAFQKFAERVAFPDGESSLQLSTNSISVKLLDPAKNRGKYDEVDQDLDKPGTKERLVDVTIPGSLLDQSSKSRRKRQATGSKSGRITLLVYANDNQLPSNQNDQFIISIRIAGLSDELVATGLAIVFLLEKAEQGIVVDPNNTYQKIATRTQCNIWNAVNLRWYTEDSHLEANSKPPKCIFFKVGEYALLVDRKTFSIDFVVRPLLYFGLVVILIGTLATPCIYVFVRKLRLRHTTAFIVNACLCIAITNVIFITGIDKNKTQVGCYVSAAFLHFYILASWFWLSSLAIYQCQALLKGSSNPPNKLLFIIPYLFPLVIVVATACIGILVNDQQSSLSGDIFFESAYVARNMCWLRSNSQTFAFVVPVVALAILDVFMAIITTASQLCCKKSEDWDDEDESDKKGCQQVELKHFAQTMALILCVFLTWLFCMLMLNADNESAVTTYSWLFLSANVIQGVLVFVLFAVLPVDVRESWCRHCCKSEEMVELEMNETGTEKSGQF